jgi:hypothetical protein
MVLSWLLVLLLLFISRLINRGFVINCLNLLYDNAYHRNI